MSSAKLTLIGFHNYYKINEGDLFEFLQVPEAVDREALINNILLRGGEFEVLYSDPIFLHDSIKTWSKKWERTFEEWLKTMAIEYNPLENYDRMEDWTENNLGHNNSVMNSTDTATRTNKVSAFNSDTMRDNESDLTNATGNNTNNSTNDNIMTRTGRAHGNIGVTTSQALWLEQMDQVAIWNLYEHITDIFLAEYVIPIY